jgi:hypothetical protein
VPTYASDYIARRVAIVSTGRAAGMTWEALADEVGDITAKGLSAWWAHRTRAQRKAYLAELKGTRFINAPTTTPRKCLRCDKVFDSTGPGNRMCTPCRSAG